MMGFCNIYHYFTCNCRYKNSQRNQKLKHKSTSLFCRKSEAEAAFQTKSVFCFFFSKE